MQSNFKTNSINSNKAYRLSMLNLNNLQQNPLKQNIVHTTHSNQIKIQYPNQLYALR